MDDCPGRINRRCVVWAGAAAGLVLLPLPTRADEEEDPRRMKRPQPDDVFVRFDSEEDPTALTVDDLKVGGPQIVAWAMDPASQLRRDGSRLNQVLLVRLDPDKLGPSTRQLAVHGIVAYSAICTHAQCTVTGWIADRQVLHCPCHQSEYDPTHAAQVVSGPAPRALAALPLRINNGKPVVAGGFIGRVGMNAPGT